MRRSSSLLALAAALTLGGCYRYVPGASADAAAGNEVRLTFTPEGAQQLAPVIGADVRSITGRVLSASDRELAVSVGRSYRSSGVETIWNGENVTIPRDAVAQTDRRTIDRRRSTLAAIGAFLGGVITFSILRSITTGGNPGSPGPGPTPI